MPAPEAPDRSSAALDVVGIGNAIVDVIAHGDDAFLNAQGLAKGSMTLVDRERAEWLYDGMGPGTETSGGSAANTLAGVASFGGRAGFIGRVADDLLGRVFTHDIRAAGVEFPCTPVAGGASATARCMVVVTPDAQRTMSTYLGAANELTPDEVDVDFVASGLFLYLEGYLWDLPAAKEAMRRAMDAAHGAGRQIALSLSDSFCVDRHRGDFLELLQGPVDVLFANVDEVTALYGLDGFDDAVKAAGEHCRVAAVTRGAEGSTVVVDGERHDVEAVHLGQVVDTTGAGDLYAAGVLYGLTAGRSPEVCGRLGSLAAGEVISHLGARPLVRLADLAADAGLL